MRVNFELGLGSLFLGYFKTYTIVCFIFSCVVVSNRQPACYQPLPAMSGDRTSPALIRITQHMVSPCCQLYLKHTIQKFNQCKQLFSDSILMNECDVNNRWTVTFQIASSTRKSDTSRSPTTWWKPSRTCPATNHLLSR